MPIPRPAPITAPGPQGGEMLRSIGAIRIDEQFSLVDVNAAVADPVVRALRDAPIRGRKLPVRFGYVDMNKQAHLMVTRPKPKS